MPTKRPYSSRQSKRTSQRISQAGIGTHHVRVRPSSSRHMNGQSIDFSSTRRQRRAERGEVNFVGTSSTTGENDRSYSKRTSRPEFAQEVQRNTAARRIGLIAFLAIVVVAIAAFVAVRAFFGIMGGRMALDDKSLNGKLANAAAGAPYYVLVSADLDATNNCDTDVDMLVLVRLDEQNKAVTCVSIPSKLKATFTDGNSHTLSEAVYYGGLGQLVASVSSLADVGISHVVTLNQEGIEKLVDAYGGMDWALAEEVDDPAAGSLYIPAGNQKLKGEQVSTLLRASNFSGGMKAQGANQCLFVSKCLQNLSAGSAFGAAANMDKVAGSFHTDWNSNAFSGMLTKFNGFDPQSAYAVQVPCYKASLGADATYSVSTNSWKSVMKLVAEGADPAQALATNTSAVAPGSFTVTVRNGAAVNGGAAQLASSLTNAGYNVVDVGNTDTPVYTETLVIYLADAKKDAAKSVADTLGGCRVIDGTNHYTFESDVLVILGSDWMPQN